MTTGHSDLQFLSDDEGKGQYTEKEGVRWQAFSDEVDMLIERNPNNDICHNDDSRNGCGKEEEVVPTIDKKCDLCHKYYTAIFVIMCR